MEVEPEVIAERQARIKAWYEDVTNQTHAGEATSVDTASNNAIHGPGWTLEVRTKQANVPMSRNWRDDVHVEDLDADPYVVPPPAQPGIGSPYAVNQKGSKMGKQQFDPNVAAIGGFTARGIDVISQAGNAAKKYEYTQTDYSQKPYENTQPGIAEYPLPNGKVRKPPEPKKSLIEQMKKKTTRTFQETDEHGQPVIFSERKRNITRAPPPQGRPKIQTNELKV